MRDWQHTWRSIASLAYACFNPNSYYIIAASSCIKSCAIQRGIFLDVVDHEILGIDAGLFSAAITRLSALKSTGSAIGLPCHGIQFGAVYLISPVLAATDENVKYFLWLTPREAIAHSANRSKITPQVSKPTSNSLIRTTMK
jgi:hypothetical protein